MTIDNNSKYIIIDHLDRVVDTAEMFGLGIDKLIAICAKGSSEVGGEESFALIARLTGKPQAYGEYRVISKHCPFRCLVARVYMAGVGLSSNVWEKWYTPEAQANTAPQQPVLPKTHPAAAPQEEKKVLTGDTDPDTAPVFNLPAIREIDKQNGSSWQTLYELRNEFKIGRPGISGFPTLEACLKVLVFLCSAASTLAEFSVYRLDNGQKVFRGCVHVPNAETGCTGFIDWYQSYPHASSGELISTVSTVWTRNIKSNPALGCAGEATSPHVAPMTEREQILKTLQSLGRLPLWELQKWVLAGHSGHPSDGHRFIRNINLLIQRGLIRLDNNGELYATGRKRKDIPEEERALLNYPLSILDNLIAMSKNPDKHSKKCQPDMHMLEEGIEALRTKLFY